MILGFQNNKIVNLWIAMLLDSTLFLEKKGKKFRSCNIHKIWGRISFLLRPTTPFLLYLLSRVEGLLEGTGVHFQIGTRRKKCTQSSQIFTGSKRTFFLLLLHAFFGFYHVATLELPPAFLNCGYMRDLHPKLHSLRCSSLDGVHIFFYHIFLLPFSL